MNKWKVLEENKGVRLDVFAAEMSGLSRSKIATMIKEEKVLLNGEITKANVRLADGDIVFVDEYVEKPLDLTPVKMDLNIVYEDDDVIVINKPRGLVVHPGAGTKEPTLVNGLLFY